MDFSPGWDCFLSLCTGVVDVAALGILVDDWPGDHQSDCGKLRAEAAAVRPVADYLSMSIAEGILLYVLIVIGPRTLSHR